MTAMADYIWLKNGVEEKVSKEAAVWLKERQHVLAAVPCARQEKQGETLSMEEILLDERYLQHGLLIEKKFYASLGGKNTRLEAKWEYELAIRAAEKTNLAQLYLSGSMQDEAVEPDAEKAFRTDAYVLGRYRDMFKQLQVLENVLEAMLAETVQAEHTQEMQSFLEDMISHGKEYRYLYQGTQPIVLFLGPTYCYNILNVFARELGKALEQQGQCVLYYDVEKEDINGIPELMQQPYKALVGFQTWLMSVQRKENAGNLFDMISGVKCNFMLDHPIWLAEQLKNVPKQYCVLTHDRYYQSFIQKYFKGVKRVALLPPGGRVTEKPIFGYERRYGITFLGTYGDYRKKLEVIRACVPTIRHLAARYLLLVKNQPDLPAEEAFRKALQHYGVECSKEQFLQLFGEMKAVIQCIMYYYREKTVRTILAAGLELHVYGDSWKESPFWGESRLIWHEAVEEEEALEILRNSKVSLNVMAWHKDGFTERIADSMLSGAVVVSDESRCLREDYQEECVLFSLKRMEELPGKIRAVLASEEERERIAEAAYRKAVQTATWEKRAEELLAIIEEESR